MGSRSLTQTIRVVRSNKLIIVPASAICNITYSPHGVRTVHGIFTTGRQPGCGSLRILLPSVRDVRGLRLALPIPLGHLTTVFVPNTFSPVTRTRSSYSLTALHRSPAANGTARNIHVPGSTITLHVLQTAKPLTTADTGHSNRRDTRAIRRTTSTLKSTISLCLSKKTAPKRISSAIITTSPRRHSNVTVLQRKIVHRLIVHGTLALGNNTLNT